MSVYTAFLLIGLGILFLALAVREARRPDSPRNIGDLARSVEESRFMIKHGRHPRK